MANGLLYQKELNKAGCACNDPSCESGPIYFHSNCHKDAPTWCKYHDGALTIECSVCKQTVAKIAVAHSHLRLVKSRAAKKG